MEEIKRILSYTRRAVDDYTMIKSGDRIAIGVSGGKDSLTLLAAMAELKRFYPISFELHAITIDMGFENSDFSKVGDFCELLGIQYHVVPTQISKIIFDIRKEKNPCSLCARMRRGALHDAAKEIGCNSIALGHHFDDVVETFMLNLFFEGRLGCFRPVTYLSRKDLTLIRPLIYAPEKSIRYFVSKNDLPIIESQCKADKNTQREEMKKLLSSLERNNKGLRYRIYGAIQRGELDGFKSFGSIPSFENNIFEESADNTNE